MKFEEAIKALKQGKIIKRVYKFDDGTQSKIEYWFKLGIRNKILMNKFEGGTECISDGFIAEDILCDEWSIVE